MNQSFLLNALVLALLCSHSAWAEDVTITPAAGSSVIIHSAPSKPAIVVLPEQQVRLPGIAAAPQYANVVCQDGNGLLGTCTNAATAGPAGATGPAGPAGPVGADRAMGPAGRAGPKGDSDSAGAGAIIPYASGLPLTVSTTADGFRGQVALLGFGSNTSTAISSNGTIDLTGSAGTAMNYAFSMPRAGTITSIAASFSATSALPLVDSTVKLQAQLYSAKDNSNSFSAVPEAVVTMEAPLTGGAVAPGSVLFKSTTGLDIPVSAGTRLLLVYSATAVGFSLENTVVGYASAGVGID